MAKPEMQLTVDGITRSVANWQRTTGVEARVIRWRHKHGWTPRQCVEFDPPPPQRRGNNHPDRLNVLTEFSPVPLIQTTIVRVDDKAIGLHCRRIRKAAGKCAAELAEEMGCSTSAVFHMEKGNRRFTQELLDRFNQIAAGWVVKKQEAAE